MAEKNVSCLRAEPDLLCVYAWARSGGVRTIYNRLHAYTLCTLYGFRLSAHTDAIRTLYTLPKKKTKEKEQAV